MRVGLVVMVCGLVGLAGCAGDTLGGLSGTGQSQAAGARLTGMVRGGQQPLAGANVYLLAASAAGYGGAGITPSSNNASMSLLTSGTLDQSGGATNGDYYVTTDSSGNFSITNQYTCTAGQQVYLYVLGGDPGIGSGVNASSGLMAALGNCPGTTGSTGNTFSSSLYIVVNEVSTVATAYAFAGFATDATHVGSSGTAQAQAGIATAFANAANLETLSTGVALVAAPAGNGTVPQDEINTLANVLAACVNSDGTVAGPTGATPCYMLFTNALSSGTTGTQPTETATAAINIAHNPGVNVANLYAVAGATPPFAPDLSSAPLNWTIALNYNGGNYLREISTPVKHIAWDAAHSVLYAAVPGTGTYANTVVPINPVTATIGTPVAVGNTPDVLALSGDDSFLYVALDGASSIVRLNLPSLTLDPSFNLAVPSSNGFGALTAISMSVAPANPHIIATIIGSYNWGPPNVGGTFVYDDTTARTSEIPYYKEDSTSLAWGANATLLYATDTSSDGTLWVDAVNSTGVTLAKAYGYSIESETGTLHFDPISGNIYSDDGHVVNPANGALVGAFNLSSLANGLTRCVPDIANNMVFFLGQTSAQSRGTSGVTILAFNAETYQLIGMLAIDGLSGNPADFVRWGNAGLAFTLSPDCCAVSPQPGPVYLLDGTFVSGLATPDFATGTSVEPLPVLVSLRPQAAAAGSAAITLNVAGSNFQPGSSVLWNGAPLATTVNSASSLQAIIPSAVLAAVGNAVVTVSNGSSGSSAGSLAFTITSATPGTTNLLAVNLAALDIAWDSAGNQLIAPVWSADPQFPNSIVAINPVTGTVIKAASVAADPTMARITSDGSYVYTGFKAVNQITQLALPSLTAPTSFSLGTDPNGDGPWYALDLQPAPGAPLTNAVILGSNGRSPDEGPLVIYNNGVQLPTSAAGFGYLGNTYDNLQWSATSSTLYAAENSSAPTFYTLAVNSSGVTLTNTDPNSFGALGSKIHFDSVTGYIYDDDGQVLNPATSAQVGTIGTFGATGLLAVDDSLNRVFILGQTPAQSGTAGYTIQSFNQTTFIPVRSISIAGVVGAPVAFTRWGTNGLAFVTNNKNASPSAGPAGMLYVISDTGFVNAN